MLFNLNGFTLFHVLVSLAGIFSGCVIVGGFMAGKRLDGWTGTFLVTTILTNASGFGFPFVTLMPSYIVGALSLVILAVAVFARYGRHLAGSWRSVFVITSVAALYFNVFVLVVQQFKKTPALLMLAPEQKEPPFAITQLLVLALFIVLGRASLRGTRGEAITIVHREGSRLGKSAG